MDQNTIMLIIWLSVFVLALIAEFATDALVSVWFCIGALAALGVTYIPGTPLWVEITVFFAISTICFIALRPLAKKLLLANSQTNSALLAENHATLLFFANHQCGLSPSQSPSSVRREQQSSDHALSLYTGDSASA